MTVCVEAGADEAEAVEEALKRARSMVGERRARAGGLQPVAGERALQHEVVGQLAGGAAFGAGVRFGSMDAATLAGLAEVATREGDGVIRLTTWRAVVLAGVAEPGALAALGLIVSRDDPALLVSACVGAPGCGSASVRTRELAGRLRGEVHVSGCSKGCAHPGRAALTLVGREGRFDVVRGGRAGDVPVQFGLTADEAVLLR